MKRLTLVIILNLIAPCASIDAKPFDNTRLGTEFPTAWQTHRTKGAILTRLYRQAQKEHPGIELKYKDLERQYKTDLPFIKNHLERPDYSAPTAQLPYPILPNHIRCSLDQAHRYRIKEYNRDQFLTTSLDSFHTHFDEEYTHILTQSLNHYYPENK